MIDLDDFEASYYCPMSGDWIWLSAGCSTAWDLDVLTICSTIKTLMVPMACYGGQVENRRAERTVVEEWYGELCAVGREEPLPILEVLRLAP